MKIKRSITGDEFYTKKYLDSEWSDLRRGDAEILLNNISELKILSRNSKVLDVGCGGGELGQEIINKHKSTVYGIDLNKRAVLNANKSGIKALVADLDERWPFKNSFFDSVIGIEIIEHVFNPDNFLDEAYRILKKDGYLVVATPNLAAWFNRFIFLFGYQPFFLEVSTIDKTVGLDFTRKLTPNREPMGHVRCFTLRALEDIFALHGFEITEKFGNTGYYLPYFMKIFDRIFKNIPSFATDITIVAKKIDKKY